MKPRAIPAAVFLILIAPAAPGAEGRAFWLTRWNAADRDAIGSCLDGMASLRANILLCQVYGDGMALYRSSFVPRSPLVAGDFDALAAAVEEGHRRGIEVHAYINVCNVWSGGLGTPSSPSHLVRAHPEWAVVDASGRSDLESVGEAGTLIFFCPEWRGFRDYLIDVATEIASNYDVDGIHLDYFRYPGGAPRCFCSEHRRNFTARFHRAPEDGDPDFIEWRFANITTLFGEVYDAVTGLRPEIKVSAALITPTGRYYQDAKRILEAGNLDIAIPMIYTSDPGVFADAARYFHENSGGRLVYTGITADGGAVGLEIDIARETGLEGQTFFAWSTLDAAGRAAIAAAYPTGTPAPPMPWKDGSPDTTQPVISGVRAAGVLEEEATIVWHSDEPSRGKVELGRTAALGSMVDRPGTFFEHAVRLAGLEASTTYHYRAVSTDAAGNVSRSDRGTLTTPAGGPIEVIVDDGGDGFSRSGAWSAGSSAGGFGDGYLFSSDQPQETAWARFQPFLPRTGLYEVAVWYVAGGNRVADARYTVVHADGSRTFEVNQKSGGGQWRRLADFRFAEGTGGYVRLTNQASGGDVVVADAARFRLLEAEAVFRRGDANGDGTADISDAVGILGYLFLGQTPPTCLDAADCDDSGKIEISDAIFLLGFLFTGGRAPPPPHPAPGPDPSADALDC